MVGMIFKPQNKSFRHFLSFRNKLTLLPLKTYVVLPTVSASAASVSATVSAVKLSPDYLPPDPALDFAATPEWTGAWRKRHPVLGL